MSKTGEESLSSAGIVGDNGGSEPACKKPRSDTSVTQCDRPNKESDKPKKEEISRAEPNPDRCQFFLQRKRRYCRTIPPEGQTYCVEHSHVLGEASNRKRIPCPLDPKHSCYEDQLKKHLKKCNAREDVQPIYFMKNVNSGEPLEEDFKGITIRSVDTEEVFKMIDIVKKIYCSEVPKLEEDILSHRILQEELDKPYNGVAAQKHLKQQASLVGHVEKMGFLKNNQCFVEFGAGKAGLSHWIQRALDKSDDTQFVLVDKSSVRYKMDVYHRGEEQGPSFERLRIDIEHLCLDKVPSLNHNKPIIGVGKHLCGGATDLMLRCLMNMVHSDQDQPKDDNHNQRYVKGLVLALCCHHRCDWQSYVGKEFFHSLGLTGRDFHIIASMTSWATCGARPSQTEGTETEPYDLNSDQPVEDESEKSGYNHPRYGSLTPEEREEIGFMCKKLIDTGRRKFLQSHDFDTRLVLYTELSLSLENVVLLANRVNSQTCVTDNTQS